MGQTESANTAPPDYPPVYDEDISVRRRRRQRRQRRNRSNKINVNTYSTMESGEDIDNLLANMGIKSEFEETPFSGK